MRSATLASFMVMGMCFGSVACSSGAEDATPTDFFEAQVLVETVDEPAGEDCEDGGSQIRVGYDGDRNGELSDDEITSRSYVCFPPADGARGQDGRDGADGADGINRYRRR